MISDELLKLNYPNRNLDRLIKDIYNDAYSVSSADECATYNISMNLIKRISIVSGLNDSVVKELIHVPNTSSWKYFTNQKILVLYSIFLYYHINKNYQMAAIVLYLLSIQTYFGTMVKYFPQCDLNFMMAALERLRKSSVAKKYGTIGFALVIANRMYEKYKSILDKEINDPKFRLKFLAELRHRINQAIKNLARLYYKVYEQQKQAEKTTGVTNRVEIAGSVDKIHSTISVILNKLSMTNDVDVKTIKLLSRVFKVNYELAHEFVLVMIKNTKLLENIYKNFSGLLVKDEIFCDMDYTLLFKSVYKNKKLFSYIKSLLKNTAVLKFEKWKVLPEYTRNALMNLYIIYVLWLFKNQIC